MSQIGKIPGQKKKKNEDLTIGKFLKNKLKGLGKVLTKKPNSHMSRLGALPGQETDTPYKKLANKFNNKSTKKTYNKKEPTPAQLLARKRIGKGTAKNPDTTIAQLKERNTKRIKKNASKKNADFKKMRSGDMSKAAFIKKYPNSQTAKKNGVTTKRTVNKKVVNNKNNKKTYKKLNDRQFNKKFDVKKGDSKLKKFTKSGGLSGLINRRLKILKNMKKKDFLLNKKK